jgi:hypothetical protein
MKMKSRLRSKRSVQNDPGAAHLVSYPMSTEGSFPGRNAAGTES